MEEKTKLPISLAIEVATELRDKHGIDHFSEGFDTKFTTDELSKISKLEIKDPIRGCCEGIENLPNLRSLSFKSEGLTEYKPTHQINSINDKDIKSVEKCKSLTSLTIVNQAHISEIDLSGMPKLCDVNISTNSNLESIKGVDKLPNLYSLTCYGNKSLQEVKGLDKAVEQSDQLEKLNLDVLLFPGAIGYRTNGTYNQDIVNKMGELNMNVRWCEEFGVNRIIKISNHQMLKMHNKACKILAENVKPNACISDTVIGVERYLAENVTYDNESLKHGHTKTDGAGLVEGPNYGANGAFNCIMKNSCVCEGYTRGEQYLLALRGIKTSNVSCIAGADTIGMADSKKDDRHFHHNLPADGYHSIVRIDDYYSFYSDPCWNAGCYQEGDKSMPYSLKTKEEISKTHTLSFEEKNINGYFSIDRKQISESIEYNVAFRNARASKVSEERKNANQQIKGQILTKDGKVYG